MQVPIVFQLNGALSDGRYLPGQYQWPSAARLTGALVAAPLPFGGSLTLQLEVGGALTGDTLAVAGCGNFSEKVSLAVSVPANAAVRWRVAFAGDVTVSPMEISVTVLWEPVGGVAPVDLSLRWVDGPERLRLFAYDPATQGFTDVSDGLSVGRAYVDTSNGTSIFLQGVEQLRVRGGMVLARVFNVGVPVTGNPRLEFTRNGLVLGTLTADGWFVPDLIEIPGVLAAVGGIGFDFYNSGTLTAALGSGAWWQLNGSEGGL
jgi:hypothetical protein